jgi:hypothetical protein
MLPLSIHFRVLLIGLGCSLIASAGCQGAPEACPEVPYADLSGVASLIDKSHLPFRFPLDQVGSETSYSYTHFCAARSGSDSGRTYHAAEDYFQPAGTPVYAMAEGIISYSGPMRGYGWLIIIDHPQANLYSLYGHLSPSRWRMESGAVAKGELIAMLGDSHENGGSSEYPLEPHLHLGIRAGQRSDYPGMGQWRWQAGWITPCPVDLGWLQPSAVIADQRIPQGGFPDPEAPFFALWWIEVLIASIYVIGAVSVLIFSLRKRAPVWAILGGGMMFTASWFLRIKAAQVSTLVFGLAIVLSAVGLVLAVRPLMSYLTRRSGSANSK